MQIKKNMYKTCINIQKKHIHFKFASHISPNCKDTMNCFYVLWHYRLWFQLLLELKACARCTQKHHIRSKNKIALIAHDDILLNSDICIYIYTYITENGCTECTWNLAASAAVPRKHICLLMFLWILLYVYLCNGREKRAHESREGSGGKVFCDQYPFIKRSKSCR